MSYPRRCLRPMCARDRSWTVQPTATSAGVARDYNVTTRGARATLGWRPPRREQLPLRQTHSTDLQTTKTHSSLTVPGYGVTLSHYNPDSSLPIRQSRSSLSNHFTNTSNRTSPPTKTPTPTPTLSLSHCIPSLIFTLSRKHHSIPLNMHNFSSIY